MQEQRNAKYLGLPMVIGRSKRDVFKFVEKLGQGKYFPKGGRKDKLVWIFNNDGKFSVKTCYKAIMDRNELTRCQPESSRGATASKKIWNSIWKIKIKPKLRIFLWSFRTPPIFLAHGFTNPASQRVQAGGPRLPIAPQNPTPPPRVILSISHRIVRQRLNIRRQLIQRPKLSPVYDRVRRHEIPHVWGPEIYGDCPRVEPVEELLCHREMARSSPPTLFRHLPNEWVGSFPSSFLASLFLSGRQRDEDQ
ncbi:disease resistance protein [Striga asiatica]|uniref:Disease resistance protein n=1 Tax=Striga asiatica TaxID=4170 RepID=A0A5A7Q0P9_STRAF|nr:disease resistance protein [Striga asiatica]